MPFGSMSIPCMEQGTMAKVSEPDDIKRQYQAGELTYWEAVGELTALFAYSSREARAKVDSWDDE